MRRILTIAFLLPALLLPVLIINQGFSSNSMETNLQGFQFTETESTIWSTATLADDFADNTVLIVLNHRASLLPRNFTPRDFPEFPFIEVKCITPGIETVNRQVYAINSRNFRLQEEMDADEWRVDLQTFRRILSLRLVYSGKENVLRAVRVLEQRDDVISASPNFSEELILIPDSKERASNAQPLNSVHSNQWGLNQISAQQAWSLTTGNHNILVGVLDTGIYADHPDLRNRVYRRFFRCFTGQSQSRYLDPHGHGTHVAGIIAAEGVRTSGIAHNARVVSLRTQGADGRGFLDAQIKAIAFASRADVRIQILNMSVSGTSDYYPSPPSYKEFSRFVCCICWK
ncbi:MAG: S8 family serine peptidase [Firmicutes bacterium]|nr:S8 family serine peptidase [Bacillota bacterium]